MFSLRQVRVGDTNTNVASKGVYFSHSEYYRVINTLSVEVIQQTICMTIASREGNKKMKKAKNKIGIKQTNLKRVRVRKTKTYGNDNSKI